MNENDLILALHEYMNARETTKNLSRPQSASQASEADLKSGGQGYDRAADNLKAQLDKYIDERIKTAMEAARKADETS